jgi:hypothetical protein
MLEVGAVVSYTIYGVLPGERPEVRALISQMTCGSPGPGIWKAEAEVYPSNRKDSTE